MEAAMAILSIVGCKCMFYAIMFSGESDYCSNQMLVLPCLQGGQALTLAQR